MKELSDLISIGKVPRAIHKILAHAAIDFDAHQRDILIELILLLQDGQIRDRIQKTLQNDTSNRNT